MKDLLIKIAAEGKKATGTTGEAYGSVTPVPGGDAGDGDLKDSIIKVINWVLGIIGIVCVIVIIIGGIQYMTSTGDPGKVKKAKDTILYAIVGLIVVILAAAIVNFVIAHVGGNA